MGTHNLRPLCNFYGILFLFIIPLFLFSSPSDSMMVSESNSIKIDFSSKNSSTSNYLFTYEPDEKIKLIQELRNYNPQKIHFFDNFPIGFVTIDLEQYSRIRTSNPRLISDLHLSKRTPVLPSIENSKIKGVTTASQSTYTLPAEIIKATQLWNEGITGSGIKIAIIDSGIDNQHDDFRGRIDYQKSFVTTEYGYSEDEDYNDVHGHGTHVAGIAAGSKFSSYPGIAYDAQLYNLKATDIAGSSTKESVIAAIDEAITQEVDIISISLGFEMVFPWSDEDILSLAVNKAVDEGINVVVSAGNEGNISPLSTISSPASASKVITVGASNGSFNVVEFSSRGPSFDYRIDPDIVAPGLQIIAPLASGGVIQRALNAIEGFSLTDYVFLSGTSMAAPVVSGALALLKQQFTEASPMALRAAIQESAMDLEREESIYTQGSGLIDVSGASEILTNTKSGNSFDLISSSPFADKNKFIELAEQVTFPGDTSQLTISFATGSGGTITWGVSKSIQEFIHFNSTSYTLSESGYFEKYLNISIPYNTPPGTYQGNFTFIFRGSTYSIPLVFDIKSPKMKVYLDNHYNTLEDSTYFNYRSVKEILEINHSIDINEYSNVFNWADLSQSEVLILSDLEFPLSSREVSYITNFHKNNGSILLVTSAFPFFNPYPYSSIINQLGINVNFDDTIDLISYVDNGRSRDIIPPDISDLELTWPKEDPLFQGVEYVIPFIGTGFKVDPNDPFLKHQITVLSSHTIFAGFEPNNKGKVMILGSELWFNPTYLGTPSGKRFLTNIFDWLEPKQNITVNTEISPNGKLKIHSYQNNQDPLSVDLSFDNGTKVTGLALLYNSTLGHNVLDISLGNHHNQSVRVEILDGSLLLKRFEISDFSNISLPEVIDIQIETITTSDMPEPSWIQDEDTLIVIDKGLNFTIVHNESDSIEVQILISSQLEKTLNQINPPLNSINAIIANFMIDNGSSLQSTEHQLDWAVPTNFSTGYYSYQIFLWNHLDNEANSTIPLRTEQGLFYIPDTEPIIDSRSLIDGRSINYYEDLLESGEILNWTPGSTISLNLVGRDTNSDEFIVYIQFIHYYLWLFDRTVLDTFEIPRSSANQSENVGTFHVPNENIPLPDDEEFALEINNQVFVLLIFLRDNQGNDAFEAIFFRIGSSFFIDTNLFFILGVGLAIFSLGAVVFLIRRSSSRQTSIYRDYDLRSRENTFQPPYRQTHRHKFCFKCGTEVPIEAMYCSSCGSFIKDEEI